MSHTVEIALEVKESEFSIFQKALEVFGWNIVENSKVRSYYDQDQKVYRYVALNPSKETNAYDIGLEIENGKVKLLTDYYGGSVAKSLGENMNRLRQEYAIKIIEDEYAWSGQVVRAESVDENGDIMVDVILNS